MAHDIKHLKPKKDSCYKQGYFDVSHSTKYAGKTIDDKTVIYRSSLEWKFCNMCETSTKVAKWTSETIPIAYELDGKTHTYWPDFAFETVNGSRYLVEVKPWSQTQKPKWRDSVAVKSTYKRNIAKWNAAVTWCAEQNRLLGKEVWKFKIVTEKFFKV